ncbi:MAG: mandelate racemase/muconate lactonizing enzyme family protein [Candidatus Puniceispirillaceae bacterium]
MNIKSVETIILKSDLDTPFAFSQGWVGKRVCTLVKITTDDGLVGWGEGFAQGLEPPEICAATIDTAFAPMLIGRNPLDTEKLWFEMYNRSRDFGRKGSVMAAISALDIALWDIAGKAYGQPVYQLLGGAVRDNITPYATGFYRVQGQGEAERLADEALAHFEAGFTHMKVKLGFGVDDDIAVMAAIMRQVQGKGIQIMVDSNHAYGRHEALRLGYVLDDYDLRWYEEPVIPEDLAGYAECRSKLKTPIAGGENEHGLHGFKALFESRAVDIAQPDVGSCGGLTAMRHIAVLAHSFGVEVNPHVWGSSVAQAASVHVLASLPVAHHSLFARQPILEYDRSDHPFRQHLVAAPLSLDKGVVTINQNPGLGIDIQQDCIDRYRVN